MGHLTNLFNEPSFGLSYPFPGELPGPPPIMKGGRRYKQTEAYKRLRE